MISRNQLAVIFGLILVSPQSYAGQGKCDYCSLSSRSSFDSKPLPANRREYLRSYRNSPPNALSSCVSPQPLNDNKCISYACNEATGKYIASNKKCDEKKECDVATGECVNSCKTYSAPGIYVVKACDIIQGAQFTMKVKKISYDMFGKEGTITLDIKYDDGGKKLQEVIWTNFKSWPKSLNSVSSDAANHLAIHKGFVSVALPPKIADIKNSEATLIADPDCKPLYNECLAALAKNGPFKGYPGDAKNFNMVLGWNCQFICPADPGIPQQIYLTTKDIRLTMPPGYAKVATAIVQLAQNCYDKMAKLFGVESSHPIYISYAVDPSAGCDMGIDEQYKLPCFITPEYSDSSIDKDNLSSISAAINSGQCSGFFNQFDKSVSDALPHEMSHNFAIAAFNLINSEGFATFSADAISSDLGNLVCHANGYDFKAQSGEETALQPYTSWKSNSYFSGACLFKKFRELYGDAAFQDIFKTSHQLSAGKTFHLFKDVLNVAAKDDFFSKSTNVHKLSADPEIGITLMQHFFGDIPLTGP